MEETEMVYQKPTIVLMGEAARLIQGQKNFFIIDGVFPVTIGTTVCPVYELDE